MLKTASLFGALLLAGCGLTPTATPVETGSVGPGYRLQAVKGGKKASPTPAPTTSPTPTPAPSATPTPPSAMPVFDDHFDAFDAARWSFADGWANGFPFYCGWKADHAAVRDGVLTLTLDDQASSGQPYSSAELRSNRAYGFGRVEGRLKAARGSGLVTSLITYTGPSEGTVHDEVDIEILGKDPTRMQVNYFTAGVGGHEAVIDLGFDASAGFHTYAFEWTATAIRWYVDGRLVHTEDGSRGALPTTPGKIMANLWPGVNVDGWLGAFSYPGAPVTAQYERVSFTAL
jgi:beta-glucanase (GH16 family)